MTRDPYPPPPRNRIRRALRLIAWNAALLAAAAALIAVAGETWLRRTKPFMTTSFPPVVSYQGTGLWKPHAEIRYTNRLDFWTVSRVNSLGFLDREPPSSERAAAGCRIAFIGDSFVEAMEVPIAQKSHVRLEALAAAALPRLNVATSAFGHMRIGQIQQLPYYDFARRLRPKLVVLVFVHNDFLDNHPLLRSLNRGFDPDYIPEIHAARRPDGKIELRPPHPDAAQFTLPRPPPGGAPDPWYVHILWRAVKFSWFAHWLDAQMCVHIPANCVGNPRKLSFWVETLRQRPRYAALLERWPPIKLLADWPPIKQLNMHQVFASSDLPPAFEDALDYMAFALEQFKRRADRDGAALVILASHLMKLHGPLAFDRMSDMAAALDIPVIDQTDYILRQGAALRDAQWRHDFHWNADGHRWAAEALLEWLQQNQDVCADAQSARPLDP